MDGLRPSGRVESRQAGQEVSGEDSRVVVQTEKWREDLLLAPARPPALTDCT